MDENNLKRKIKSFTDLDTWKIGHKIVVDIYRITEQFPEKEQFGLTNQLRRAGVSFTSNIAEGFSRNSPKEKIQFYRIALGSLTEIQNQLLIARDIHYLNENEFKRIAEQTVTASKLANGLIKFSKTLIQNT